MPNSTKISVYDEWMGHVVDLKRIAKAITNRPTMDSNDQVSVLEAMASSIADDAANYEAERKQDLDDNGY
jgi:phage I-like protein